MKNAIQAVGPECNMATYPRRGCASIDGPNPPPPGTKKVNGTVALFCPTSLCKESNNCGPGGAMTGCINGSVVQDSTSDAALVTGNSLPEPTNCDFQVGTDNVDVQIGTTQNLYPPAGGRTRCIEVVYLNTGDTLV